MVTFEQPPPPSSPRAQSPRIGVPVKPKLLEKNAMMGMMMDKVHIQFSDIKKAFRTLDVDNSGKLGRKEIKRAFAMWNLDIDDKHLDDLLLWKSTERSALALAGWAAVCAGLHLLPALLPLLLLYAVSTMTPRSARRPLAEPATDVLLLAAE